MFLVIGYPNGSDMQDSRQLEVCSDMRADVSSVTARKMRMKGGCTSNDVLVRDPAECFSRK